MARVTYGAIITNLAGSIGGITFQNNKSGSIARLRPRNNKVGTTKQFTKRSNFTQLIAAWNALSLSDQEDWNTFAAANPKIDIWGASTNLSGLNWFMSVNGNRQTTGQAILSTYPTYTAGSAIPSYLFTLSGSEITINFGTTFAHPDDYLIALLSPPLLSQSTINKKNLRVVRSFAPGSDLTQGLKTNWTSIFSIPWPPSASNVTLKLICMLFCINKDTGISGQGVLRISEFTN